VPGAAEHRNLALAAGYASRMPVLALGYLVEKVAVCHRIKIGIGHEGANELTLIDFEGMRPNQITIGRNTPSPSLKLENDRVVLSAQPRRQLPLR
jgi:hypothetical protein